MHGQPVTNRSDATLSDLRNGLAVPVSSESEIPRATQATPNSQAITHSLGYDHEQSRVPRRPLSGVMELVESGEP